MDENNKNITGAENSEQQGAESTEPTNEPNEDTITMPKAEYDKALQSAADKVRGEYAKKIKELKAKLPPEKTEAEKDFEKRLASLEAREKAQNLKDALTENGIDLSLAGFLKDDADVKSFADALKKVTTTTLKQAAYKPEGHKTGESVITKEEFAKMTMEEKESLYLKDPDLYMSLRK